MFVAIQPHTVLYKGAVQMKHSIIGLLCCSLIITAFSSCRLNIAVSSNKDEINLSVNNTDTSISDLNSMDLTGDGIADCVDIEVIYDTTDIHTEQFTLTDSSDGRKYTCDVTQISELLYERLVNSVEVDNNIRHTDSSPCYYYKFGLSESNCITAYFDDLESVVHYNSVIYDNNYHFSLNDGNILLTYNCLAGYNEVIGYIDVTLTFTDKQFVVSDISIRENSYLIPEITDRKSETPVSDDTFTYQRYKNGWKIIDYNYDVVYNEISSENFSIPTEYMGLPVVCIDCTFFLSPIVNLEMKSVCEIVGSAFFRSERIKSVKAPNLIAMDNDAFNMCSWLESIDIDNAVYIGRSAFGECNSLTKIELPHVEYIGIHAFYGSGLQSIELPQVEYISRGAFRYCINLRSIYLPEVRYMESDIFTWYNPPENEELIKIYGKSGGEAERYVNKYSDIEPIVFIDINCISSDYKIGG